MPGPARKPTALKILAGNPGHRPLPANEPKPSPSIPSCPSHLSTEARKEWKRMVPELEKLGLLSNIDRAALAAYCVAYGRWVEAERELKKNGLTQKSPNGYIAKSTYLAIADKCYEQLRRMIQEFGLSPASRARVTSVPKDDDDDAFFGT